MEKILLSFLAIFVLSLSVSAQVYTDRDTEICNSKFALAANSNLAQKPIPDVIAEIGKSFLGTNYAASTLESEGEEELVVNLKGLDCTTFLENTLVFARLIKSGKTSFNDYMNELTIIRYRDGKINGYTSRLHYFSDWISENVKKGIINDVTKDAGGEKLKLDINFMSTHPASYKRLKENPAYIPVIEKLEKDINTREYYYIPREKLSKFESKIQNGDLVAITTSIKGLDIGHVGIAVTEKDGRIHLLHAPTVGSKVQITNEPLADYLMKVNKHSGVIILRAVEP